MLNSILNKITESKFFKAMRKLFASLIESPVVKNTTDMTNSCVDNSSTPNPFDVFGHFIAEKIKKLFKKFGKKFKNEDRAMNVISTIARVSAKVVCVAATLAFACLVLYAFIKLIPTIIISCAIFAAVYLGIELTTTVLSHGMGVN